MLYRLFEWKLILQVVGSLMNLFHTIMIIFVSLYELKSRRSFCAQVFAYLFV